MKNERNRTTTTAFGKRHDDEQKCAVSSITKNISRFRHQVITRSDEEKRWHWLLGKDGKDTKISNEGHYREYKDIKLLSSLIKKKLLKLSEGVEFFSNRRKRKKINVASFLDQISHLFSYKNNDLFRRTTVFLLQNMSILLVLVVKIHSILL